MKYIKSILEFKHMGWDEYVKKIFNATRVSNNEKIGILYHGTSIEKAIKILKSGFIKTANEVNKHKDGTPWYMNLQHGKISNKYKQDIKYGEFIYASKMNPYKDDFYGAMDSSVVFILNGDAILKNYSVFNNPSIEGSVYLIQGNIPLTKEYIKEIAYDPYYIGKYEEEFFHLVGKLGIKMSYGYQDVSKRNLETITEGVNDNYLYHLTTPQRILNILRTNKLNLSSAMDAAYSTKHKLTDKPFHMAFSRTPNAELGYGRMEFSRIVFNKNKLKNRFQLIPFNSWGKQDSGKNIQNLPSFKNGRPQKEINYELNMRYEYEDWLVSNKPVIDNATSYIERIDLLVRGFDESDDASNNYINRVVNICNELGIKVFVYKSREDMSYGKNAIETPEYKDIGYYHSTYDEGFDWAAFIALIIYDNKYIKDYELCKKDAIEYAEKNGIPLSAEDASKVHDRMEGLYRSNRDAFQNLINNIHNFFMNGKSGIVRDKIHLLTAELKKYKCRTVDDLIKFKSKGEISQYTPKVDWSDKYQLGKWKIEWFEKQGVYVPVPNDTFLSKLADEYPRFRYNPYSHYKSEDVNHFNDMVDKGLTSGNFINWILNKYTPERAKELIEKSSYNGIETNYTLLPIKNK